MDIATAPTVEETSPKLTPLERAVAIAGGQSALAGRIGRSQPTVWAWLNENSKVSAEDAIAIERATGVPAEQINPSLRDFARMRGLKARRAR